MLSNNYSYEEHQPSPELGEFIDCYWTFSGPPCQEDLYQRILPNGCCELVFHFGSLYKNLSFNTEFVEPQIAIFGPIRSASCVTPLGQIKLAAIRFQPTGFYRLFNVPTYHLTDQILDLTEFNEVNKYAFIEELVECGFANIVSSFEKFLLRFVPSSNSNDSYKRIEFAVRDIQQRQGILSIRDLPEVVNLSERHFELLFKTHVGMSAKSYANLVRFNNLMGLLLNNWEESLTELAHQYHFHDQAHFIKNFKKIVGLSPTEFISSHKGNFFFERE